MAHSLPLTVLLQVLLDELQVFVGEGALRVLAGAVEPQRRRVASAPVEPERRRDALTHAVEP